MKIVRGIDFLEGSREEQLPNFESNFPYIASRAELNQYAEGIVPWHWHKAVEVFYIERGNLEYSTPNGYYIFPQGSGGMVNSNVLHTTKPQGDNTVQLLHIFDPSLIGGETENIIVQKYIMPIITAGELDMIPLYPDNLEQKEVLDLIKKAFNLSEQEDYTSALNYIIDTLEKRGYVDADFKERVWEKESKSSMIIDNIAIPHAVQKAGDAIVLSVGVFREPMPYKNDNIQVVFLLALPEEIRDENLLICVYDEIMSLVKNDELIEKITHSGNYIDFMKVLYKRN